MRPTSPPQPPLVPSEAAAGVVPLDGYERAARLSYALWRTMPDDALLDAAAAGDDPAAHALALRAIDTAYRTGTTALVATRPVPQPASSTRMGAGMSPLTKRASPWMSTPRSRSSSNRRWWCRPAVSRPNRRRRSHPERAHRFS